MHAVSRLPTASGYSSETVSGRSRRVLVMVSLYRVLDAQDQQLQRQARRARQRVQAWIEREMEQGERRP